MKKILKNIAVCIIIFVGFLVYNSTKWALNTFGDISVEEIIFNLKVPMAGVNKDYIIDYINSCLKPSIIFTSISSVLILYKLQKRIIINLKLVSKQIKFQLTPLKYIKKIPLMLSIIFLVISLGFSWRQLNLSDYLKSEVQRSKFIEDNYVNPDNVHINFPEKKRNLIYIYVESMEYTYASKDEGGYFDENLIPELTEMAHNNINFSATDKFGGITPSYGATWTMGAIFAQTSGLPLKLPIYGNNMNQYSSFMPGVKNLGDILNENGYNNMLMIGSDANYAGRRNYFEQHGNYEIYDYYSAIKDKKIPEDYYEWWGFEDRKLFEYAKEKLLKLSSEDKPFNFTMLTADTHFEDGYLCPLCENKFGDDQYENVIACSNKQVSEFVKWIQQQDFYEDTTIVIVGDHTTMDTDFCEEIDTSFNRGIYDVFINSAVYPKEMKGRYASTMDMFPTTLASLGVKVEGEKLGLGTNLFSGEQTIIEKNNNSIQDVNDELRKKSTFYEKRFLYSKNS